ncbi:MAG: preprotein translocase subunit SecG [Syntrophales bacterium]
MHIFVIIVHVIVSFLLVLIVLLQKGKGASMGAAFGGSSQTIFGSSGPGTFLGKITAVIAVVFMATSLYLAYFSANKGRSVMDASRPVAEQPALPQGSQQMPAGTPPAAAGGATGEAPAQAR